MIKIQSYIQINAPVEKITNFFLDLEKNYAIWSDKHISFVSIKGTPTTPGSIFEMYEYFGKKIVGGKYIVKKVIENNYYEWCKLSTFKPIYKSVYIEICENDKGFLLKEVENIGLNIPVLGKVGDWFLEKTTKTIPKIKKHQEEGLENIKMYLEGV